MENVNPVESNINIVLLISELFPAYQIAYLSMGHSVYGLMTLVKTVMN